MGLLFEMLLGMLLGSASYALLCKWLANKVEQEIHGKAKLNVSKPEIASKRQLDARKTLN